MILGRMTGLGAAIGAVNALAGAAVGPVRKAVTEAALWGQGAVAANAPKDTGDYARSISHRVTSSASAVDATIGTNRPQGRRLEFGFYGVDSLGRHYNQAPRPHWEPVRQQMPQVLRAAVVKHLGSELDD